MRYFKLPESKNIEIVTDDNLVVLYERQGFVEVDKKGNPLPEEPKNEEE